jgi:CRP/FNR family transcriptional regulator
MKDRYFAPGAVHASAPGTDARPVDIAQKVVELNCTVCWLRGICLPRGLDGDALDRLDAVIHVRQRIKRKETLYRPGDRFTALYAIRLGTFKTLALAEDGCEQITGYHMPGDVIGADGAGDERHTSHAVALEDSEVCVLPYNQLDRLSATVPELRHNLFRLASRDLCRDHAMMLTLGSRSAEARLTLFLLDLAERFRTRGYSAREFVLRMTREEIASYLGLKLETVSRLFSSLQEQGLLQVQGRAVKLLDVNGLRNVVGAHAPALADALVPPAVEPSTGR